MDQLFELPREPAALSPGAVHIPGWMDREQQRYLLRECARWAVQARPEHTVLPGGGTMTVRTLCLGRRWEPYRYRDDPSTLPIPEWLVRAGRRALYRAAECDRRVLEGLGGSEGRLESFRPDAVLVNFYGPGASMGLHQDRDEAANAPVVSLSIGDACTFRFGTPEHRGQPYIDVRLESGDLVVFGGPSRLAYHGVPKVFDGSAPAWCEELLSHAPGRINLTLRQTSAP